MIRLLLVDDHPIVRAGLRAVFAEFADLEVVAEADDGGAGLAELARLKQAGEQVDVVLMDLQMKPVDGIEATRQILASGGPPVLILTTFDTQKDIVAALEAGAMGYLLKDAPPQQIHDAVLATVAGERTVSPEMTIAVLDRLRAPVLSSREVELVTALATGATNRQLAAQLFISEATVKTHLVHIYTKLGVDNRTAAIARARDLGLV